MSRKSVISKKYQKKNHIIKHLKKFCPKDVTFSQLDNQFVDNFNKIKQYQKDIGFNLLINQSKNNKQQFGCERHDSLSIFDQEWH